MLSPTATLEQSLIDVIKKRFDGVIKTVEALGGAWTEETLKELLRIDNSIYVAFIGNKPSERRSCVNQTWAIFLSIKTLNGRRVTPQTAYLVHDYLIALLNRRSLEPAAQAMLFTQSANLYSTTSAKKGIFVYGLYFTVDMPIPTVVNPADLGDFITYYQNFNTDPKMEILTQLPQDENE